MIECNKKSKLRCLNCIHVTCDMYIITQILLKLNLL